MLGAFVDRTRLLADIVGELPNSDTTDPALRQGRISLVGGDGASVYQWGTYEPAEHETPWARLDLTAPLENWSLQYFTPAMRSEGRFGGSLLLNLAAGLGALVLALVGLAAYFYRESTREMREAAARVSFVNQVSHELKTPLTNIRMYAELLERSVPEGDEKAARHLDIIVSESQRLSRLIGNVLTFARKQNNKLTLHPVEGSVDRCIQFVLDHFQCLARSQGCEDDIPRWRRHAGALRPRCAGADPRQPVLERGEVRRVRWRDGSHQPAAGSDHEHYGGRSRPRHPDRAGGADLRAVPAPQQQAVGWRHRHGHWPHHRARAGPQAWRRSQGRAAGRRRLLPAGACHPMKVLIAEDDANTRNGLAEILEAEGYETIAARDGREALRLFAKESPDFVCLDIMMPGISGYDVCREIRRSDPAVPVIFISAKSEEIDKVVGLELGADDFIVKPFGVKEVVARIRAVTRRRFAAAPASVRAASFRIGDLEVSPSELRARRNGTAIEISLRDVKILALLRENQGSVVTRDAFFRECWGLKHVPNSRTLDQHIAQLRKRIEIDPKNPAIVQTVHGAGYRYEQ